MDTASEPFCSGHVLTSKVQHVLVLVVINACKECKVPVGLCQKLLVKTLPPRLNMLAQSCAADF